MALGWTLRAGLAAFCLASALASAEDAAAVLATGIRRGVPGPPGHTAGTSLLARVPAGARVTALVADQECCLPDAQYCDLPPCGEGMTCVFVGEEVGPPVCRPTPAQEPLPVHTVASVQAALSKDAAGFVVGEPLADPYDCSPQPCGDLPQLGPLTGLPAPTLGAGGAVLQSFHFAEYPGSAAAPLPGGRPMARAEAALRWRIQTALDDRVSAIAVTAEDLSPHGVVLQAQIGR
mmetsp:Transcript_68355/g.199988  ORF Transcript_68355/g.199988 Transcript_68355/m.199988 type:complete len:234 (+) Transcript_68355:78-779(+)